MTCRTWVEELGSTLSLTWDIAGVDDGEAYVPDLGDGFP
jgi:hypothetical protein